jgi:CubicO group peptidase (beta-lactamase class C family)
LHRGSLDGERVLSEAASGLMMRSHTPPSIATQGYGVGLHVVRPGYEYAYNGIVVNDPERAAVPLGRNTYLWDGAANTWFWVDPSNEVVFVGLVQLLIPGQMLDLPVRTRQIAADMLLKPDYAV